MGLDGKIMLIDDEQDIVTIFSRMLSLKGYSVAGFTNPLDALTEFQQNSSLYKLLISDIRMPQMNGWHLIENAKKIKPDLKVFAMSAFEISSSEVRRASPDEYLKKPFTGDQLRLAVEKHFGSKPMFVL